MSELFNLQLQCLEGFSKTVREKPTKENITMLRRWMELCFSAMDSIYGVPADSCIIVVNEIPNQFNAGYLALAKVNPLICYSCHNIKDGVSVCNSCDRGMRYNNNH